MKLKFELGDRVTDQVDGITGIVTAVSELATGCIRYCVSIKKTKTKDAEHHWCAEPFLKKTGKKSTGINES